LYFPSKPAIQALLEIRKDPQFSGKGLMITGFTLSVFTGTLTNGDSINNDFNIDNGASIVPVIPESCILLPFALGRILIRKQ